MCFRFIGGCCEQGSLLFLRIGEEGEAVGVKGIYCGNPAIIIVASHNSYKDVLSYYTSDDKS